MKTATVILVTLILTICTHASAGGRIDKLSRGVKDLATAPLAIGEDVARYKDTPYHPIYGTVAGLLEGAAHSAGQVFVSVFDILTFPWVNE